MDTRYSDKMALKKSRIVVALTISLSIMGLGYAILQNRCINYVSESIDFLREENLYEFRKRLNNPNSIQEKDFNYYYRTLNEIEFSNIKPFRFSVRFTSRGVLYNMSYQISTNQGVLLFEVQLIEKFVSLKIDGSYLELLP